MKDKEKVPMNDIFANTETMQENEHPRFYTAESVMRGHPDKLCDLIADSVLDACLQHDPASRVACEHLLIIWAFSPGFPTLFNIVFPNRVENLYFTLYRTISKITPFSCRNHYQVFHKGDGLFPC